MFFIQVKGTQQQPEYEEIKINLGVYSKSETEGDRLYDYYWYYNWTDFPYCWEVENKKYIIDIEYLSSTQIIKNTFNDIDVIIVDGIAADLGLAGVPIAQENYREIIPKNLQEFLESGKGYIGHCGGATYPFVLKRSPRTWTERITNWNSFLKNSANPYVNNVKIVEYHGSPVFCEYAWLRKPWLPWKWFEPFFERHPEYIGTEAWYEETKPNKVPTHFKITKKNHPIFKDYFGDSLFCQWIGGPGMYLPNNTLDSIDGLAYFTSEEDLSNNQYTDLTAWKFNIDLCEYNYITYYCNPFDFPTWDSWLENLTNAKRNINWWEGWEWTDIKVEEGHDYYGKSQAALVTIDNFDRNDGEGRLLLFTGHPIANIWDREGRYIKRVEYNTTNAKRWGLYRWWDDSGTPDDESDDVWLKNISGYLYDSDLYWFTFREVAWTSGLVPDEHMPPIYGRSHVLDLDFFQPSKEFTLNCAVGDSKNKMDSWETTNLSLYYKYNDVTNNTWTDWTYYASDYSFPWSFTFDADEANGTGEYYFCSKLDTTLYYNETFSYEHDSFPPGPDTKCFVIQSPAADFTNEPTSPYTNMDITFYDQSLPSETIVSWSWDFGDGNTSTDQNATHQYTENGNYTILLNVTDNESNYQVITKNITIQNTPPCVGFNSAPFVIIGPDDEISNNPVVSFESNSTDPDGYIVNWTWDFGDGTMGYGESVNHTYSDMGSYPVTLRVTDDDNTTSEEYIMDSVLVANAMVNKSLSSDDPGNFTWNSIQKGLDNLSTFNLLFVIDNTYMENIIINKSVIVLGENRDSVIIDGSIMMNNPFDHELVGDGDNDFIVNMSNNVLLFHFNNDISVGEDYSNSNTVFDSSGQGNNGTFYGATWVDSSLKGVGAFNFNGISNMVNVSSIHALLGENVTVSAWIFWTEGSGSCDPIISQSNAAQGYCLYINNSISKPAFKLGSTDVVSSVNLSTGWHHIVGTHNGSSSLLKIYIDGKNTGNTSISGAGINSSFFVGFDNISSYFNGTIDEVAVWNRTLSDEEVFMMYHGNFGGSIACLTVQNADVGVVPCNRSIIYDCNIVNNTVGIYCNDSLDVAIDTCNISGSSFGIQIYNSTPGIYDRIHVVDSNIYSCNNGLIVNNSSTISIAGSFFNCSSLQMRFNESDFSSIYILSCDSAGNVAPDIPDLTGINLGDPGVEYTYSSVTNDSNNDQILYMFDWGDDNTSDWLSLYDSNILMSSSHTFENQGGYFIRVKAKDVFNNETSWSDPILFKTEILPPLINSVDHTPETAGYGEDIVISVNATDDQSGNYSGVKSVNVNITFPDETTGNYSMTLDGTAEMGLYTYTLMNPWIVGQYNYTIWVVDNAYNVNSSTGHSFNVSAQADISVCTINDSYGNQEWVNITDPPMAQIGYEFLDDGEVLHVWNRFDSYYFNTSNGIQFSNHYDEFWSQNVLMLGYYNNDIWNLIYRVDELSGFNKDIESDDETFVNATLWKDLSYAGYDFRLAIRYYLGVDDNELTVIPYIKNIGDEDIPFDLGFAWELKDIQVDMTPSGDYIEIDGTSYYLNQELDEIYNNMVIPCFYIRENLTSTCSESLYLRWDESLNDIVRVKSRTGQYNAPVTLGIKIGTLGVGQEKYTSLFWHDASEITYYFDQYMEMGEEWTTNPGYMVDGSTSNYSSTGLNGDVELCLNNTCAGSDLGTISKVEIRCFGYYFGMNQRDIILRPVFSGKDGDNHVFVTTPVAGWSSWFDITSDTNAPVSWMWDSVRYLDCDVQVGSGAGAFTLKCSKVEVRVTYTVNYAPGFSNPYPADGSTGISIGPMLNITVSDPNGDNMNITWLSNSSGSWQVFGTNNSVGNGTYHQVFTNATINGQWWYWKVNISDDENTNISDVYKFYTGYESKIVNTGSTNLTGYLLMQVQFWNDSLGDWIVADNTFDEDTPRTINIGGTLALDTIFNGNVNTADLLYGLGNGTYRIYAAFRDPDGNVLVCDDETELVATYEFTVTFD